MYQREQDLAVNQHIREAQDDRINQVCRSNRPIIHSARECTCHLGGKKTASSLIETERLDQTFAK
jgi:hypothetical protein